MPTKKSKAKPKKTKEKKEELEHIPESDFGTIYASWDFPEFTKYDKSRGWYLTFILIFLAMLVWSYFTNNLLFAIILVIFVAVYFLIERKEPVNVEVLITEDGLILNNKLFEYSDFAKFYIIYYPPEIKNLYFEYKNGFKQRIAIPLEDQNPVKIREALLNFVDEDLEKEEMPAAESISRIFKL